MRTLERWIFGVVAVPALGGLLLTAGSPVALRPAAEIASVPLLDDAGGQSMFVGQMLAPAVPVSRCITVSGDGGGTVALAATGVTGTLVDDLTVTVDRGTGGSFGDCSSFTGSRIYTGPLRDLGTTGDGVPTGWNPAVQRDAAFRITVTLDAASTSRGATARADFVWRLVPPATTPPAPVAPTPAPPTPAPSTPAPSAPVPSTPAPSKPVPSTPVPSKPVTSAPAPAKPGTSPKPAPTGPAPRDPAPGVPDRDDPATDDPATGDPGVGDPADGAPADAPADPVEPVDPGASAGPSAPAVVPGSPGSPAPAAPGAEGGQGGQDGQNSQGSRGAGTVAAIVERVVDAAVLVAAEARKHPTVPVALVAVLGLFLLLQNRADHRDPKLALAPVWASRWIWIPEPEEDDL